MAGIYVHIPFCKSRCIYCDFYSTTSERLIPSYVAALCREIALRRSERLLDEGVETEASRAHIRTIYIGGGTPSLLDAPQLRAVLSTIRDSYDVAADAEVTLEMNPEDVTLQVANDVASAGFNRVSLGLQTFDDDLLRLLRRRHDAQTAIDAVRRLQDSGCTNVSIDLIYGLPGQTLATWEHDLDRAFGLDVQHLSAYALSYEDGTPLTRQRDAGLLREADDEVSVEMYRRLCSRADAEGFDHYEISNFARPGFASRHNSSYWTGASYLGFGPGAHSYDGDRLRRANVSSLGRYITADGAAPFTTENLNDAELYDEAVMCGLRTSRGIDVEEIGRRFGSSRREYLLRMAGPHLRAGRMTLCSDTDDSRSRLRLTASALMTSDDIMSDLMA